MANSIEIEKAFFVQLQEKEQEQEEDKEKVKQHEKDDFLIWQGTEFYEKYIISSVHTKDGARQDSRDVAKEGCPYGKLFLTELKGYKETNPKLTTYREYHKYNNEGVDKGFQIDLSKIVDTCDESEKEGRTPLLFCSFPDIDIVWKLDKEIALQRRKNGVPCNDKGIRYGERKRPKDETYLYLDEAIWYHVKKKDFKFLPRA